MMSLPLTNNPTFLFVKSIIFMFYGYKQMTPFVHFLKKTLKGSKILWVFLSVATLVAADYGFTCPPRFMSGVVVWCV